MIDETVREIKEMHTHSSSTVATHAARALDELQEREFRSVEEFFQSLERNSTVLRQANLSHASLQSTQRGIVAALRDAEPETVDAAKEELAAAIDATVDRIDEAKDRTAEEAQRLLVDGDTLLTHDYSQTVMAVLRRAADDGNSHAVYTTEARPRFMGRRMARELGSINGIDPTLIVDSAAGYYLEECDRVLLGMDCIADGKLYNRVGTFQIAAAAGEVGVPVTVVGASAKLVDEGFRFENDFRSSVEVMGEPTTAFEIANPAYDATPVSLIDTVVTDGGIRDMETPSTASR